MSVGLMEKAGVGYNAACDKKARDIVLLDIRRVSTATDFLMICNGQSTRQVQSIADEVIAKLREIGARPMGIEGYENARWILLDYCDMVIHIFHEETRKYYEIDRLWDDAPGVPIKLTQERQGGGNGQ